MAGRHAAPVSPRSRRAPDRRGVVPLARLLDEVGRVDSPCRWCDDPAAGTLAGRPVCRRCRRRRRAMLRALGRVVPGGVLRRLARA